MTKTVLLLLTVSVVLASTFNLEPPENKWIMIGEEFELQCRSSLPLKSW
jgi:hypothetical protein